MSKSNKKGKKNQQPGRAGKVPAHPPEEASVRAMVFLGAIVAVITILVYLPALDNGFVNWDDGSYVYENQNIRSLDGRFLWWALTSVVSANWHPITLISYGIDFAIWGLNPRGFHLTNIIFHAFNVLLVFILTLKLWDLILPKDREEQTAFNFVSRGALIAAAVAALFFGLHPLRVESVVWVSERKDVLCAFFFLLSILAYLEYARATSRKTLFYGLALFSFALALMSKPMAVTLPLVLLILDWYPLGRFGETKKIVFEKLPFLVLSFISSVIALWVQKGAEAVTTLEAVSLVERTLVGLKAYMFYIYKTILPFDLAPFYPYPEVIYLVSIESLGSIICFIVISLLCVFLLKKSRAFSALWLYYLITLLPVIGIVQVGAQSAADRYTYLPLLGLAIFIGTGIGRLYDKGLRKEYAMAIFVLIISVFAFLSFATILQTRIWKDGITLWSHEVELYPNRVSQSRYNLVLAFYDQGQMDKAVRELNQVLRIKPDYANAHNRLGVIYYGLGRTDEAMEEFEETLRLDPEHADAHNNVGSIYAGQGHLEKAIEEFLTARKSDPKLHDAYKNLGLAYALLGRLDEAITQYKEAISLKPDFADAHFNLGLAYNAKGLKDEAKRELKKALEIKPGYSDAKEALKSLSK